MISLISTRCSAAPSREGGDDGGRRDAAAPPRDLGFARDLWDVLRRPSSVFSWRAGARGLCGRCGVLGGFNTALEITNTEKFCTGCHEMRDNVFAELKSTIHFSNRSGVERAVGLSRSAQLDRQDRAKDAGLEGSLGPSVRHDRHAREIPGAPARTGAAWSGRG